LCYNQGAIFATQHRELFLASAAQQAAVRAMYMCSTFVPIGGFPDRLVLFYIDAVVFSIDAALFWSSLIFIGIKERSLRRSVASVLRAMQGVITHL
jgi:hypothetical protein